MVEPAFPVFFFNPSRIPVEVVYNVSCPRVKLYSEIFDWNFF